MLSRKTLVDEAVRLTEKLQGELTRESRTDLAAIFQQMFSHRELDNAVEDMSYRAGEL